MVRPQKWKYGILNIKYLTSIYWKFFIKCSIMKAHIFTEIKYDLKGQLGVT